MKKVKTGVIGTGHLGNYHTKILSGLREAELIGIFDIDSARMEKIANDYGTHAFANIEKLLERCDAVIIASSTATHREIAERAFDAGCHVLVEKPIAENTSDGRKMVEAAENAGRTLMVGHVEHFNPAFEVAEPYLKDLLFVEGHRLTIYRGRGADVSVLHDLLIHDLELLLAVIGEEVISMEASGSTILTDKPDIANVRLKFAGGCVANLTASRISLTNMRKMRFFMKGAYVGVDFGGEVSIATLLGRGPAPPEGADRMEMPGGETILRWNIPVPERNALQSELEHFLMCVRTGERPRVSGGHGLKALELADVILEKIG